MLADIFGKSAILRGVRCPGHWRILVSDFLSPSFLTMGVDASDGTRFGRWPEVSRCPDLLVLIMGTPKKVPSLWETPMQGR